MSIAVPTDRSIKILKEENMSKHILRKHVYGFTVVSNNVIKELKSNLSALGLYSYLLSLPDNWEFYKTVLSKECGIGIKKLEKLLKVLSDFGLVKCGQKRDEKGRFTEFYMDIYDTETLKINSLESYPQESTSPEGQICRTAETVRRFGEAIKEELQKKELLLLKNKQKSFYEPTKKKAQTNSKKHDFSESMNAMANEKRHIENYEKEKYALMPSVLREYCKNISHEKSLRRNSC